jgi:hypothetical protein
MFCNTSTSNAPLYSTAIFTVRRYCNVFLMQKVKGAARVQYETRIMQAERQKNSIQETRRKYR